MMRRVKFIDPILLAPLFVGRLGRWADKGIKELLAGGLVSRVLRITFLIKLGTWSPERRLLGGGAVRSARRQKEARLNCLA